MYLYLLIFTFIIVGYFRCHNSNDRSKGYLVCWMVFLCIFVGGADMLGGYDRYIYGELFDEVADVTLSGEGNYLSSYIFRQYPTEIGFDWLNVLISFITCNRYLFIFILTAIIYTLLFIALERYTNNYFFALLLFMGLIFFFTFTYLRQLLGVGVAWLSIKYVYERKLWKFLTIMLAAVLLHNSAIILVPIYFVPIRKFTPKSIMIIMGGCLIVGASGIPSTLFDLYGSVSEMQKRASAYAYEDIGFKIEYIIESLFFLYIILSNYKLIPRNSKNIVLLNMALMYCAILMIFFKSLNGGRLGWYYLIGLIATLSYISTSRKKMTKSALALTAFSTLLFIRILLYSWGPLGTLYPYKTFFTNGVRDGDWVHDTWEYDNNYDNDKFYRK